MQLRYVNDKILDAFKDWTKLFALIVGGYFWLKIEKQNGQGGGDNILASAKLLLTFLGVCYAMMIFFGARSWLGYRKAEHKLMPDSPAPRCCGSVRQEIVMVVVIVIVTGAACYYIQ